MSFKIDYQTILDILPRLGFAVLAVLLCFIIGKIVQRALGLVLRRADFDEGGSAFFSQLMLWVAVIIGLFIASVILGIQGAAAGLLASGSVVAIVLGFAFKEIGENFLAGLFLAFSRPFRLGDLIRVDDLEGTVRAMALRHTHIRTANGQDIYIPNARLFTSPLANYTQDGYRRMAFRLGLDYGDDSEAARALLRQTVSGMEGVLNTPRPACDIVEFSSNYMTFEVRYWVDAFASPLDLGEIRSRAMSACRKALIDGGYTLSSGVTSGVEVTMHPAPGR